MAFLLLFFPLTLVLLQINKPATRQRPGTFTVESNSGLVEFDSQQVKPPPSDLWPIYTARLPWFRWGCFKGALAFMHHFNHFYGTYLATATVLLAKIVKSSLVYCSSLFLSHPSGEFGRLDVSKENKQQLT